jgi:hypothetical protein
LLFYPCFRSVNSFYVYFVFMNFKTNRPFPHSLAV